MSTNYSSYAGCYSYDYLESIVEWQNKTTYIGGYEGSPNGYDIGYQHTDGSIWMASDNATSPVKCYAATSGDVIGAISSSCGIGSDIRGVTFDPSTGHLWVSNPVTNKIYELSDLTGISETSTADFSNMKILVSTNPFRNSLQINICAYSGAASLEIFDLCGRYVHLAPIDTSYIWDCTGVPSGIYIIRVTSDHGDYAAREVVKL